MRIALLKKERESAAGVELIQLCSTITADGSLSDEEIAELQRWLEANKAIPFPAIAFVHSLIERIIRDHRITDTERADLYKAVERILPKELKDVAAANRRRREAEAIVERTKNAPEVFDFMVAGVRYGNRSRFIRQFARAGVPVWLLREPNNPASPNAIKILIGDGQSIGYMPEVDAVSAAPLLDAGCKQRAVIKKIFYNRVPVVVAELFPPSVALQESPLTEKLTGSPAKMRWAQGCLVAIVFAALVCITLVSC